MAGVTSPHHEPFPFPFPFPFEDNGNSTSALNFNVDDDNSGDDDDGDDVNKSDADDDSHQRKVRATARQTLQTQLSALRPRPYANIDSFEGHPVPLLCIVTSKSSPEKIYEVSFPLTDVSRQRIIQTCQLDYDGDESRSYQESSIWRLEEPRVQVDNPAWQLAVDKIVGKIQVDLGFQSGLKVILSHALMMEQYPPSKVGQTVGDAIFNSTKGHDCRAVGSPEVFATLAITLPVAHLGGDIIVEHEGSNQTLQSSEHICSYSWWRSTAQCKTLPIRLGTKFVLVYTLIGQIEHGPMSLYKPEATCISEALREWKLQHEQQSFHDSDPLIFPLETHCVLNGDGEVEHENEIGRSTTDHNHTESMHRSIKRQLLDTDLVRAKVLKHACDNTGYQLYFCNLSKIKISPPHPHQPCGFRCSMCGNWNQECQECGYDGCRSHRDEYAGEDTYDSDESSSIYSELNAHATHETSSLCDYDGISVPAAISFNFANDVSATTHLVAIPNEKVVASLWVCSLGSDWSPRDTSRLRYLLKYFRRKYIKRHRATHQSNGEPTRFYKMAIRSLCKRIVRRNEVPEHRAYYESDLMHVVMDACVDLKDIVLFKRAFSCSVETNTLPKQIQSLMRRALGRIPFADLKPILDEYASGLKTFAKRYSDLINLLQIRIIPRHPSSKHEDDRQGWFVGTMEQLVEGKDANNQAKTGHPTRLDQFSHVDWTCLIYFSFQLGAEYFDTSMIPLIEHRLGNTPFAITFLVHLCSEDQYQTDPALISSAFSKLIPGICGNFNFTGFEYWRSSYAPDDVRELYPPKLLNKDSKVSIQRYGRPLERGLVFQGSKWNPKKPLSDFRVPPIDVLVFIDFLNACNNHGLQSELQVILTKLVKEAEGRMHKVDIMNILMPTLQRLATDLIP